MGELPKHTAVPLCQGRVCSEHRTASAKAHQIRMCLPCYVHSVYRRTHQMLIATLFTTGKMILSSYVASITTLCICMTDLLPFSVFQVVRNSNDLHTKITTWLKDIRPQWLSHILYTYTMSVDKDSLSQNTFTWHSLSPVPGMFL